MIRPIHPFPARMAPDLALAELGRLKPQSAVLDPMAGSGTVVRQASELGHQATGFDMDPLAVLMTRVWTTPYDDTAVERVAAYALKQAATLRDAQIRLPWLDDDEETRKFIDYWFAEPQRSDVRRLAFVLSDLDQHSRGANRAANDVLRLALSRIIITKDQGASLARDTSHSRPHRVGDSSKFDVMSAFERSIRRVRSLLMTAPPPGNVHVGLADARSLRDVANDAFDAVLTSPPYLNAIDYMRGHRLSLVWLGYRVSELRQIRADSIGAERGISDKRYAILFKEIQDAMAPSGVLAQGYTSMMTRYAEDVYRLMSEIARVLKSDGRAILVVGNSCLKGVFIRNSDAVIRAASMVGLRILDKVERDLINRNRYLPMPNGGNNPLGKRIRTETVLTFAA